MNPRLDGRFVRAGGGLAEHGSHGVELLHKPYSIEALSRVLRKAARERLRAPAPAD